MTPEAQRIAIAEACPDLFAFDEQGEMIKKGSWKRCDPLSDLNAMHEAEVMLTDEQHNRFRKQLAFVVGERESPAYSSPGWRRRYVSATAAQRAEALLRTLGRSE